MIRGRQEALAVNGWSRPDASLEQDHKARQILILGSQTVQDPRTEAGTADPRPAVIDQELRLRVGEALVITGPDYRNLVGLLGDVG